MQEKCVNKYHISYSFNQNMGREKIDCFVKEKVKIKIAFTMGLEPTISRSGGERLIH